LRFTLCLLFLKLPRWRESSQDLLGRARALGARSPANWYVLRWGSSKMSGTPTWTDLSTNATCQQERTEKTGLNALNRKRSTRRAQVSLLKLERHAGAKNLRSLGDTSVRTGGSMLSTKQRGHFERQSYGSPARIRTASKASRSFAKNEQDCAA